MKCFMGIDNWSKAFTILVKQIKGFLAILCYEITPKHTLIILHVTVFKI